MKVHHLHPLDLLVWFSTAYILTSTVRIVQMKPVRRLFMAKE
jgi:hypothetical protein